MSKRIYACRDCGFVFPRDLFNLIEQNIQVYCERCGSPFILEGVKFRPAPTPHVRKLRPLYPISEKKFSYLEKAIQILNKISFIPIFLFTVITLGLISEITLYPDNWLDILINRSLFGLIGLILIVYDRVYIAPQVKEKKYNAIFVDSLCWGILGCILYGTGVIILIKGALITCYVILNPEDKELKIYDFGLLVKNSLNEFSAKAGFLIILYGILGAYLNRIYLVTIDTKVILFESILPFQIPLVLIIYIVLMSIALVAILIDNFLTSKIREKKEFELNDAIKLFVLGILGILFCAAGIFILLKGILILILFLGKPSKPKQIVSEEKRPEFYPTPKLPPKQRDRVFPEEKVIIREPIKPIVREAPPPALPAEKVVPADRKEELKKDLEPIEIQEAKKEKPEKKRKKEELELRLHESLLPIKNEKDKKLVKEYFSKIFAVLSKDLRKQIIDLKISKKEKKELLQELAFLTKEEQAKYVEALVSLYQEIPRKLIEKIRKLPNVKPKHYDKIVDQLKYLDAEEQIKFVQFLEENA